MAEFEKASINDIHSDEDSAAKRLRDQAYSEMHSNFCSYIDDLAKSASTQLSEKETLLSEITETISTLKTSLKKQTTMLELICLIQEQIY